MTAQRINLIDLNDLKEKIKLSMNQESKRIGGKLITTNKSANKSLNKR